MPNPIAPLDDAIDRKALRALRERFLALNRARLEGLRSRLTHDQRMFVDALPLLLHSNHAALPGFVDFNVGAGIERYTPDRHAIAAVRTFALSFTYERFVERERAIGALYVTAPSRAGDAVALTASVCCARALHDGLERKLAGIVRFAAQRAIELTCELIDADAGAFRLHRRTPDLARDAFYRSAILLAGRYPIWWLVPPELDDRHAAYCARLKAQRFIGRDETIDLGPAERIPFAQCIVAGVDALDRALVAPYAHVPTAMLLEAYAAGAEPLARLYKRRVWNADAAVDATTLAHELVAAHLTRSGTPQRLDLARQCLLAGTLEPARQRELAAAWGWTDAQIRRARADRELSVAELDAESARVNAELAYQHGRLSRARDAMDDATRARLDAVGERIERWMRRPFGALTRGNCAVLPRRIAGTVHIDCADGEWRIADGRHVAFAAPRLAVAMAWAHLNRVTLDNLRTPDTNRRIACGRILDLLAQRAAQAAAFRAWIVNAQEATMANRAAHGDAIVSGWDDALDFSGFHANLIAGIDVLDVGPDGIVAAHHVGDRGLVDALAAVAAEPGTTVHVGCVAGGHERNVEERLAVLFDELRGAFADPARWVRFVVALGDGYAMVERTPAGLAGRVLDGDDVLYRVLAQAPAHGHVLVVDSRSARLEALRQLCRLRAVGTVDRDCVLVHDQRGIVRVLVATRDGAIHRLAPPDLPALDVAYSIAAYLAVRFATQRDRSARLYVARGAAEPLPVNASNVADGRYVTAVAGPIARRGLAHALAEKFAIERDAARGVSTL